MSRYYHFINLNVIFQMIHVYKSTSILLREMETKLFLELIALTLKVKKD